MSKSPRRRLPPAAGLTSEEKLVHESFARRLHKAMLEKGMSPSDLATAVWGRQELKDKRGNTVYKSDGKPATAARNRDRVGVYLKGAGFPDPKNLSKIAKALGMKEEELAPEIAGAAVEREVPDLSMVAVAGHHDKVLLRVNRLVPLDIAIKVLNIITEHKP